MTGAASRTCAHYLDWSDHGRDSIWRYALAIVLSVLAWFVLPIPIVILATPFMQDSPFAGSLMEYSFLPGFIAILLIVPLLLGRASWTVALPRWPVSWMPYLHGIALGLVLTAAGTAMLYPFVEIDFQGFGPLVSVSVLSVVVTLVGLIIQTGFEELLFRGLIMQFTMRLARSAPVAIVAQALLFGFLHIGNMAAWGGNMWGMTPYVAAGLAFGWAAWRTGSLLVPAALHLVNNASGSYLIGVEGDVLQSVAPWLLESPTIVDAAIAGLVNLVLTVALVEWYVRHNREVPDAARLQEA